MDMIINYIREIRNGGTTIDEAITSVLSEMDNYRIAQTMLNNATVVDDILIQEIGMNRKSRSYDIPYAELYRVLDVYRSYPEDCVANQLLKP